MHISQCTLRIVDCPCHFWGTSVPMCALTTLTYSAYTVPGALIWRQSCILTFAAHVAGPSWMAALRLAF